MSKRHRALPTGSTLVEWEQWVIWRVTVDDGGSALDEGAERDRRLDQAEYSMLLIPL